MPNKNGSLRIEEKPAVIACAEQYGIERAAIFYKVRPALVEKWVRDKDRITLAAEAHRERQRLYMQKRYDRAGCTQKNSPESRQKWFRKHVFKKAIHNLKNRLKKSAYNMPLPTALDLWSIAKKQGCRCALSGIRLTADNLSVDHITPLVKGGTSDKSNLQLLEKRVNIMKHIMTDEELISLCHAVIEYRNSPDKTKVLEKTVVPAGGGFCG